ncbi:MAG: hypothetical protein U0942_04590 [Parvibaculum sp.]|uniref:hypothetical protein n=1 Tax=Parvibaculum sp. TaxID=2024848 RepID=UPI002ABA5436|nr:hypothetical protein [Parvibaculum sp.]MDZ4380600.1 hypothetical protein [Parvibaculum sp.]
MQLAGYGAEVATKMLKASIKIGLVLIGTLAISAVAYEATSLLSDTYRVALGQHVFNIPTQYSRQGAASQLTGADEDSRSYMLEFSAEDVAAEVSNYKTTNGSYRENIRAVLIAPTFDESKRYQSPGYLKDIWNAEGSYRDAIIESYAGRSWLKVYRKIEYPYSWAVLREMPEKNRSVPENVFSFWIANCLSGNSPITQSGEIVICQSYALDQDIVIDFYISEQNLDVIEDVRLFLKSKIELWKE